MAPAGAAAAPAPSALPVLSFGSAPPPAVAQLPAVPLQILPGAEASSSPSQGAQSISAAEASQPGAPPIDLAHVARTVLKAKRVAVVCGAGISTASGIPDFRSGAGLFESLKKQYPDAKLSSGKDLFDVGLFASESNAAIFFNMIAELKKQTDAVEPTAFHSWLKHLDDDGKLFRVYTQNIDALEEKAGLTYGLGDKKLPLPPRRKGTAAPPPRSPSKLAGNASSSSAPNSTATTRTSTPMSSVPLGRSLSQASAASTATPRGSPAASTPTHSAIPRVIPLHGHLSTLSCSACKHSVDLAGQYVDLLSTGSAPVCPACLSVDQARSAAGERSRGVGMMRPDVVLYGEEHKDGDRVGEITQRDLMGQRPDLLIVVGTTLKVKGTKRLVRELAKVIKPVVPQPSAADQADSSSSSPTKGGKKQTRSSAAAAAEADASQARSRRRPARPPPIHTVYLNYDFPTPAREWAGVFDCWLRGDIQEFVEAVKREEQVMKREVEEKERKRGEKRKRDSEASAAPGTARSAPPPAKRAAAALNVKGLNRKPLVPAQNAQAPAPAAVPRSPPKPAPLARFDPNQRTRSSAQHAGTSGGGHSSDMFAMPGAQLARSQPSGPMSAGEPARPAAAASPFAPIGPEQHYRQPYQQPSNPSFYPPMYQYHQAGPQPHGQPFQQLYQPPVQQQIQQFLSGATPVCMPFSNLAMTVSSGMPLAPPSAVAGYSLPFSLPSLPASQQSVHITSLPPLPPTPSSSSAAYSGRLASSAASEGTAPTSVPESSASASFPEKIVEEPLGPSLRRQWSSSSLSSISSLSSLSSDEEEEEEEDMPRPEPVHAMMKAASTRKPRPSRRGSSSGSSSARPAGRATMATAASAPPPRRRSSRSSTASATLHSIDVDLKRKSASRSPTLSTPAAAVATATAPAAASEVSIASRAAGRKRSSQTVPPDVGASASKRATTRLNFQVTKGTVAGVTGTAKGARGVRRRK
ncbi:hypothetical protein JCM8202_002274 [Rhodotorula sphaerocarpa]